MPATRRPRRPGSISGEQQPIAAPAAAEPTAAAGWLDGGGSPCVIASRRTARHSAGIRRRRGHGASSAAAAEAPEAGAIRRCLSGAAHHQGGSPLPELACLGATWDRDRRRHRDGRTPNHRPEPLQMASAGLAPAPAAPHRPPVYPAAQPEQDPAAAAGVAGLQQRGSQQQRWRQAELTLRSSRCRACRCGLKPAAWRRVSGCRSISRNRPGRQPPAVQQEGSPDTGWAGLRASGSAALYAPWPAPATAGSRNPGWAPPPERHPRGCS